MTYKPDSNRSSAIAAALILLVVGVAFYFLPPLVLWLSEFSPYLAVAVGSLIVLGFFLIFYVRSRYQARRDAQR